MEINVEIPFNRLALPPKERREKKLERLVRLWVDDVCSEYGCSHIDVAEGRDGQEFGLGDFEVSEREAVEIGKMFVEKGYKASIDYYGTTAQLYITNDPDYDCNSRARRNHVIKTVEIGKDAMP